MTLYSPISSIYCWRAEQQPFFCCSQHIVSFSFPLININTLHDELFRQSQLSWSAARWEKYVHRVFKFQWWYYSLQATIVVTFPSQLLLFWFTFLLPLLPCLPAFQIGLGEMNCSHWGEGTNRQWLQMEFGQWSEIPIQKIDRTLFTNWSLKFQRGESHKCYIRSQRAFDF